MLKDLKIEGFRSIKGANLSFRPLTVLIGANGSGKSNLLDLFDFIKTASAGKLGYAVDSRGGFGDVAFKGGSPYIVWELRFDLLRDKGKDQLRQVAYSVVLSRMGSLPVVSEEQLSRTAGTNGELLIHRRRESSVFRREARGLSPRSADEQKPLGSETELAIFQVKDQQSYPTAHWLSSTLQSWIRYEFNVGPTALMREPHVLKPGVQLRPGGGNLTAVLYNIQQQHSAAWAEINEILRIVYPDFDRMSFPAEGGDGKIVLRWYERPYGQTDGLSINLLSDGMRRFLCLLAVLKTPTPPPLICIDEPELGLHPDWIKVVAELLQSASGRTQVVVATHSPQLISQMEPDDVIVTERVDGETHFNRLSSESLQKWLKEFALGDLWLAGQLGGRP